MPQSQCHSCLVTMSQSQCSNRGVTMHPHFGTWWLQCSTFGRNAPLSCYYRHAFQLYLLDAEIYILYITFYTNIFYFRLLNACINLLVLYVKFNTFAGYFSNVHDGLYNHTKIKHIWRNIRRQNINSGIISIMHKKSTKRNFYIHYAFNM